MGASVDDRLSLRDSAEVFGRLSEHELRRVDERIEDMRQRDGVPREEALRIMAGSKGQPFGAARGLRYEDM